MCTHYICAIFYLIRHRRWWGGFSHPRTMNMRSCVLPMRARACPCPRSIIFNLMCLCPIARLGSCLLYIVFLDFRHTILKKILSHILVLFFVNKPFEFAIWFFYIKLDMFVIDPSKGGKNTDQIRWERFQSVERALGYLTGLGFGLPVFFIFIYVIII